jgi:hypothetical protein
MYQKKYFVINKHTSLLQFCINNQNKISHYKTLLKSLPAYI